MRHHVFDLLGNFTILELAFKALSDTITQSFCHWLSKISRFFILEVKLAFKVETPLQVA